MFIRYLSALVCLVAVALFGGCDSAPPETVARTALPLSFNATSVIAISNNGCSCAPNGWRPNGITYNDNASRCVALKASGYSWDEFALVKFEPVVCPAGEVPVSVSLAFSATEWTHAATARMREVLVDWDPPPTPCSNGCTATTHAGFVYRKTGQQWTGLGASGIGSDVSSAYVDVAIPASGTTAFTVDATSVLLVCAASGLPCSVRWESVPDGWHYYLASGGVAMHVTCEPGGGTGGTGGAGGVGGAPAAGGGGQGGMFAVGAGGACQ